MAVNPAVVAAIISGATALGTAGMQAARARKQRKAAEQIKVGTEEISPEQKKALAERKALAGAKGFAGSEALQERQEATRANILREAKTDPRTKNIMLAESMKRGSDAALESSIREQQSKQAAKEGYLASLEGLGQEKQDLQRRQIEAAARARMGLLSASQANIAGAGQSAMSGAATVGSALAQDGGTEKTGTADTTQNQDVVQKAGTAPMSTGTTQAGLMTKADFMKLSGQDRADYLNKYGENYL